MKNKTYLTRSLLTPIQSYQSAVGLWAVAPVAIIYCLQVGCISILLFFYRCLVVIWLVPRETAAVSARSVYIIQPCTIIMSYHFMQSTVHACVDVTCHLHFWQNGRDLLPAAAVTWGWNGYQSESWHRKLPLEKKILALLLLGFNPGPFFITSPML